MSHQTLSRVHAKRLVAWAERRPEARVLSADLTSSTEVDAFRERFPERFLSFGVAEQNMVSFAGGLAREGLLPLIHTFAVFLYRRAYDQIAVSCAYPCLRVRFFGFLPGVTTPGGATHQAIEDIALMRALPNMTVVEVGDATEIEGLLDAIDAVDGPVYVRMLRGEVPRLFDPSEPLRLGRARRLAEASKQAPEVLTAATSGAPAAPSQSDVVLCSSGICTEEALRAVSVLRARGVTVDHLHVSTLDPFDDPTVDEAISRARRAVVTHENHVITGGLGSAVAERMSELGIATRLHRVGIRDTFLHGASRAHLMREYGLDALALVRTVERALDTTLGIDESDLAAVRFEPVHSEAKAEAL